MAAEAPDMVSPTFFLWEIIQKFFFLAWGFHILATLKNIFCHPGGSQWVPGGFWLVSGLKRAISAQMSIKIKVY